MFTSLGQAQIFRPCISRVNSTALVWVNTPGPELYSAGGFKCCTSVCVRVRLGLELYINSRQACTCYNSFSINTLQAGYTLLQNYCIHIVKAATNEM